MKFQYTAKKKKGYVTSTFSVQDTTRDTTEDIHINEMISFQGAYITTDIHD